MKHSKHTCNCCGEDVKNVRDVKSTQNRSYSLCTSCNLKLVKQGRVYFTKDTGLRVVGENGDFLNIEEFKEFKPDYWETREKSRLHAQMDNQSMVGWDVHESY